MWGIIRPPKRLYTLIWNPENDFREEKNKPENEWNQREHRWCVVRCRCRSHQGGQC